MGASGQSPLTAKPSETNLLMAAAEMHKMGKFAQEPAQSMPEGMERPKVNLKRRSNRPLKVVK